MAITHILSPPYQDPSIISSSSESRPPRTATVRMRPSVTPGEGAVAITSCCDGLKQCQDGGGTSTRQKKEDKCRSLASAGDDEEEAVPPLLSLGLSPLLLILGFRKGRNIVEAYLSHGYKNTGCSSRFQAQLFCFVGSHTHTREVTLFPS